MRSDSPNSRAHSIPRTYRIQVSITFRWQTKWKILIITPLDKLLISCEHTVHFLRTHFLRAYFSRTHGTHFRTHAHTQTHFIDYKFRLWTLRIKFDRRLDGSTILFVDTGEWNLNYSFKLLILVKKHSPS